MTHSTLAPSLDLAALGDALCVTERAVLEELHGHGLRPATVAALEWIPAVDVCWLDGADAAERNAIRMQYAADDRATPEGIALLDGWLTTRPRPEFFEAGRRAIRLSLRLLDEDAREATLDRIVAICMAAGRAGGGTDWGSPLSAKERRHIDRIRRDLMRAS